MRDEYTESRAEQREQRAKSKTKREQSESEYIGGMRQVVEARRSWRITQTGERNESSCADKIDRAPRATGCVGLVTLCRKAIVQKATVQKMPQWRKCHSAESHSAKKNVLVHVSKWRDVTTT